MCSQDVTICVVQNTVIAWQVSKIRERLLCTCFARAQAQDAQDLIKVHTLTHTHWVKHAEAHSALEIFPILQIDAVAVQLQSDCTLYNLWAPYFGKNHP